MDDFVQATSLEPIGDGRFRAELRQDWALWGPAGGYLCALALRAAGSVTTHPRPVSFACQYLSMGRFEPVDLVVTSLREGRRTQALRVDMVQGDRQLLAAQVWAAETGGDGLVHDAARIAPVADPLRLPTFAEQNPGFGNHPFMARMDQRPLDGPIAERSTAEDPELHSLFRFMPRAVADDDFADAARAMLVLDTFSWLASGPAHPGPEMGEWIAPNLDFHFRFHRSMRTHEWLNMTMRAPLADAGLITAEGTVHGLDGSLLASGASQLLCAPRPERFR